MKGYLRAIGLPYGTAALTEFGQAVPTAEQQAQLEESVVRQSIAAGASVIALNTFGARRAEVPGAFVGAKIGAIANLIRQNPEITWALACGPSGDCYKPETGLTREEAKEFHARQLANLGSLVKVAPSNNMVLFETFPGLEEAIGAAQAVKALSKQINKNIKAVLSFALGPDGKLRSGETLRQAIKEIDQYSDGVLAGFGANCCDLDAVNAGVATLDDAKRRFTTVYPNAAKGDPARLDGCNSVVGLQNPGEVYRGFAELLQHNPQITTVGGCCGWDQAALAGLTRHLGIVGVNPGSAQTAATQRPLEIQIASY